MTRAEDGDGGASNVESNLTQGNQEAASSGTSQNDPEHVNPQDPTLPPAIVRTTEEDRTSNPPNTASTTTTFAADFDVVVHEENTNAAGAPSSPDPSTKSLAATPTMSNIHRDIPKSPLAGEDEDAADLPFQDARRNLSTVKNSKVTPATASRRRKRPRKPGDGGRVVRLVELEETPSDVQRGLALPSNHYECTLHRRAIRKRGDEDDGTNTVPSSETESSLGTNQDEYGDISLGMKLTVLQGKVIVQQLNPLQDGRASPAQLVGVIQRGDVLLSINNQSLLDLPIDQLMKGLAPLSTPDANGFFHRRLRLRFAAGEGLTLLETSEVSPSKPTGSSVEQDGASEMFSLFPMVDQLSGMPLFDQTAFPVATSGPESKLDGSSESNENEPPTIEEPTKALSPQRTSLVKKAPVALDESISADIARDRLRDRDRFMSEFFEWSDDFTGLLKPILAFEDMEEDIDITKQRASHDRPKEVLTLDQLIERGRRAILGARAISDKVENVDKGMDIHSFKSWNSTLSRYSRAGTRRRQVLDAASLPVNFGRVEETDEDSSIDGTGSTGSDDEMPLDADELLVRLAAHDEVWRKQVIEFLQKVMNQSDEEEDEKTPPSDPEQATELDAAMSRELGSFLFGESMSRFIKKKKKTLALPSEDITAVLFDLATKISSTIPDEITMSGSLVSQHSAVTPFAATKRPASGSDVVLATNFLLNEALPAWLKSFRPLPWAQRRILWPVDRATYNGSTAASTVSDDSLTIDSFGASQQSPSTQRRRRKNLREQIEEMEMNMETRAETCFLVTYYFSQKLLPKLLPKIECDDDISKALDQILDFVKEFGSYLKLHTCLAYAAVLKAEQVIDLLLDLAKHDPKHKETVKRFSKGVSLVFYEPTMLSVVLKMLKEVKNEFVSSHWLTTIDLCASAYPDVRPWQVRQCCLTSIKSGVTDEMQKKLDDLYYLYLSQLLHPTDGHDSARRDGLLVKEWCELSVRQSDNGTFADRAYDRQKNFFAVASRTSSDHLAYTRNLELLLTLCGDLDDSDLALDVAGEILEKGKEADNEGASALALDHLRSIGRAALDLSDSKPTLSARTLKRILRIYRSARSLDSATIHQLLSVPNELLTWIEHITMSATDSQAKTVELLRFLADEAVPRDVLEALVDWTSDRGESFDLEMLPILHTLLRREVDSPRSGELSTTLLRLRQARLRLQHVQDDEVMSPGNETAPQEEQSIWNRMSMGMVTVLK